MLTFTDDEREFFDRDGWDYKILLESDDWISKNGLKADRYRMEDYMKTFHPNDFYKLISYGNERHKDEIVLIVSKK